MDISIAQRFLPTVRGLNLRSPLDTWPESLCMQRSGPWATYYAPFDHVNERARLVLVGITPGLQQASNALTALQTGVGAGSQVTDALQAAKKFASFSGPMRSNLVALLDGIGVAGNLGLASTSELFAAREDLVHFTSVLRYPVTVDGKNYSGTPRVIGNTWLENQLDWFESEVRTLPNAIYVPLGPTVTEVMESYIRRGLLNPRQVLAGLPHPSGANAERIAYFLGRKPREALSSKVDPGKLDRARAELTAQLRAMSAAV